MSQDITHLFFEGGEKAWVLGHETAERVIAVPAELAADILMNPLWRVAEKAEIAAHKKATKTDAKEPDTKAETKEAE